MLILKVLMLLFNGGKDWTVALKTMLDISMTGVSFLGPIGFTVSASYFLLDTATNGFGGFGNPNNL